MYEAEKRVRRYERLYGQRLLRPLVAHVLRAAPDPALGGVWLDWEAGPGVLSSELLPRFAGDATLLATDDDRAAMRVYHSHTELDRDERCFARQDPPDAIGIANDTVDVAIGHWRWQFLEQPERGIAELCRIVKPEGAIILSFLVPGGGGSLHDAFARVGQPDIARAIAEDGLSTSRVRELLRAGNVTQIEVRQVAFSVTVGGSSRPMMDPLLLDFLLPRWMSRASGQEVTSVTSEPFDLGPEPLVWEMKVGIASARLPAHAP
jgi:SAM-dependent methyltransferase